MAALVMTACHRPTSDPPAVGALPAAPASTIATTPPMVPATDASLTPEDLAAQASSAWAGREARGSLEQAVSLWDQAVARRPTDSDMATRLARACFLLADGFMRLSGEDDAALAAYEKGLLAGERAIMALSPEFQARVNGGARVEDAVAMLGPGAQESLFWYASNLTDYALTKGFTTTLFYKDRALAVMQRVLTLGEAFYFGAPHRTFGAYYARAPSFAGGDLKKSREHFDKAVRLAPDFFANKVLYAELYATRSEDRELFVKLLSEVKGADASKLADVVPEQRIEQQKADKLLAQVDAIF